MVFNSLTFTMDPIIKVRGESTICHALENYSRLTNEKWPPLISLYSNIGPTFTHQQNHNQQ